MQHRGEAYNQPWFLSRQKKSIHAVDTETRRTEVGGMGLFWAFVILLILFYSIDRGEVLLVMVRSRHKELTGRQEIHPKETSVGVWENADPTDTGASVEHCCAVPYCTWTVVALLYVEQRQSGQHTKRILLPSRPRVPCMCVPSPRLH